MSSTTERHARNGQPAPANEPDTLPFPSAVVAKPAKATRSKPARPAPARPIGEVSQKKLLALLLQGASPLVACHKLNLRLAAFWHTLEHDAQFAAELQRVWDTLSFNVVAALYRAAIEGNGPAQQFWLKHRPPPRWAVTAETNPADELDTLSDAELLDRARAEAPDLADEIAARIAAETGGFSPAGLSEPADGSSH
jgi:hypothetical protein